MEEGNLARVLAPFKHTLEALNSVGLEDNRLFAIYAEYLVALRFEEIGHKAQVVNRRSYDILLDENTRIEVKTGKHEDGCAAASFYKGSQIADGKFDYCVFLTYEKLRVKEILVFRREELEEVAKKPRGKTVVRYPKTNPCILLRYDDLFDYYASVEQQDWLDVEVELHKHPERFRNRWDKIGT